MTTEVTQDAYEHLIGVNPSNYDCEDCPVNYVSWNDAAVFANELSEQEELDTCYDCSFSDSEDLRTVSFCSEKEEFS